MEKFTIDLAPRMIAVANSHVITTSREFARRETAFKNVAKEFPRDNAKYILALSNLTLAKVEHAEAETYLRAILLDATAHELQWAHMADECRFCITAEDI